MKNQADNCGSNSNETPWPKHAKPLMVGGVGGSGTRVVAQMLTDMGYYLGKDLNGRPLDNIWFTFLLKRPKWYKKVCHDKALIHEGLRILETAMRGGPLSFSDKKFILLSNLEHSLALKDPPGDNGRWPLIRTWNLLCARPKPPAHCRSWGWKEPNTHVYLEHIAEYFPTAKYIQTIRHGLDMAFSRDGGPAQEMVNLWGFLYGVKPPASPADMPRAALEYWVKSNRRVIEIGKSMGDKRFMLLNFDELCVSPKSVLMQMLDFLEINPREVDVEALCKVPAVPKSMGRHRDHDYSHFPPELVEAVKTFGFEVGSNLVKA